MRIINLTSHSRRGLAKCNGGKLLIRRPGSRAGGIRRAFKSSGFFVFSEVCTLENPTIPLLLYLFQIKEIPAVLLTFKLLSERGPGQDHFSTEALVRAVTLTCSQAEAISSWCEGIQLQWQWPPRFTLPLSPPPSPPHAPLLLLLSFLYPLHHITLTLPPPERQLQNTLHYCVCVLGGLQEKIFKKSRGHKELMERVWEARRNSIRHSGRIRHLELLLTHTNVLLQSALKNIWIWFENNPYIASSTYVRQIYITWVMCNCVCVCGDGGE